jgi:hypothetical protein
MSLYPTICHDGDCWAGIDEDDDDALHTRRLLYLLGFRLIASTTDARANCKSTLPSVRTLLTSIVFSILRYSSLLLFL